MQSQEQLKQKKNKNKKQLSWISPKQGYSNRANNPSEKTTHYSCLHSTAEYQQKQVCLRKKTVDRLTFDLAVILKNSNPFSSAGFLWAASAIQLTLCCLTWLLSRAFLYDLSFLLKPATFCIWWRVQVCPDGLQVTKPLMSSTESQSIDFSVMFFPLVCLSFCQHLVLRHYCNIHCLLRAADSGIISCHVVDFAWCPTLSVSSSSSWNFFLLFSYLASSFWSSQSFNRTLVV